jgi:hypothetical protein
VSFLLPQSNQQPKTTFVGVVLLSVKKTHHHTTTTTDLITIQAVPGHLGSWFFVCSLILKEDYLNFFKGRQPQFFFKWKTT